MRYGGPNLNEKCFELFRLLKIGRCRHSGPGHPSGPVSEPAGNFRGFVILSPCTIGLYSPTVRSLVATPRAPPHPTPSIESKSWGGVIWGEDDLPQLVAALLHGRHLGRRRHRRPRRDLPLRRKGTATPRRRPDPESPVACLSICLIPRICIE